MTEPTWPTTAAQWRAAMERGLSISPQRGRQQWSDGELPESEIGEWIGTEYDADRGFHSDFVPALKRNLRGLLAWVHGDGDEPDWSGSDE